MKFAFGLAVVAAAALALGACDNEVGASSSGVTKVVSTTSFGMCVGYCTTQLEIGEGQAVLTRTSRGGRGGAQLPDQRFTKTLSAAEWADIADLAQKTKLDGLPETIGCPDCADGGAESLTIVGAKGEKKITFDHGAAIEQAALLLEKVRAIRAELTPKE